MRGIRGKVLSASLVLATVLALWCAPALAAVTFVSATNSVSLVETIDENGQRVFVLGGNADGESTDLTFSVDSVCPGVAMTGGAEFTANWSCAGGVISATVTNRGGMSFGPSSGGNAGTYYVTFSDPPAPPGQETPPAELSGIQISLFGDISSWNLSGEATDAGAQFGVELSGSKGGEAHFRMDLPQAAVTYLGGVLGVFVGGKPDPFATVTTNDDGSVSLEVDIASLSSSAVHGARVGSRADTVTKKITTGERTLGVAFNKTSVKTGGSVGIAMCAGTEFSAGAKVPVKFTVGGKSTSLKKTFVLDSAGCARTSVRLRSVSVGTLTAKVTYGGDRAQARVKIAK